MYFETPVLCPIPNNYEFDFYYKQDENYVKWDHPVPTKALSAIPAYSFRMNHLISYLENTSSVTSIGSYAFDSCEINYPLDLSSVTSIGNYAFQNCKINDTFILRDVNSVGSYAFYNANAPLANFELMKITSVSSYGFSNFTGGNVKVNINTLTSQGMYMFENSNIQLIGDKVTLQGNNPNAFYKSNLPETLTVNNNYSSYARFSDAKNTKNLILNASSQYFGNSDFARMPDLDTITINGDISINASSSSPVFNSSGKTAIINGKVNSGSGAYAPFQQSTIHTAILNTNPSKYLFYNCSTLKNLYINCAINTTNTTWKSSSVSVSVYYNNLDDLLNSNINLSLCSGGYYYINNDNGTITIPSNVSKINQYIFSDCANNIEIGDNVITEIGKDAFYKSNLNNVVNLPFLLKLDWYAFYGSTLKTFSAPLLTNIPAYCFAYSSLESAYLPRVQTIANEGLTSCKKLKELVLPAIRELSANSLATSSLNKIICGSNTSTIVEFYSTISTDTALSNLISVYKHLVCLNTTPPTMSGAWTTTGILTMFVPDESVELYKAATNAPVNIKPISEYFDYRPMTTVSGRYISADYADGAHHDKILESNSNYRSVLTTCNAGEEFVCEDLVSDFSYYLDSNGNILSQITATDASNTLIVPEGATEMILCRNATSLASAFKDYKNPLEGLRGYEDYEW